MSSTENRPRRFFLPRTPEPQLWVPTKDLRVSGTEIEEYLGDLKIWVKTDDGYYPLRSRLRTYSIEHVLGSSALISWGRINPTAGLTDLIKQMGWQPQLALRDYQLAIVIKVLLQEYDWSGSRAWPFASDNQALRALYECCQLATLVLPKVDRESAESSKRAAQVVLLRVAHQQFGDFDPIGDYYPRAILLLQLYAKEAAATHAIALDQVLQEQTGLTLSEMLFLALGLYSFYSSSPNGYFFEPGLFLNSRDFPGLTPQLIGDFLRWLSIDYESFRRATIAPTIQPEEGYELYHFNPLVEHPIIRTPENRYVVPVGPYLLRRVTEGLFYDLIRSPRRAAVGSVLGRAIELYVRRLLEDLPKIGTIIGEQQYRPGKSTCEWIVNDSDRVLVIECKRAALRQRAKTTGKWEDVKQDLNREDGIIDGILKLDETAKAIRNGYLGQGLQGKPISGLLVTLDDFPLANAPLIRDVIDEILHERGVALDDLAYQICPVSDLEFLCRLATAEEEFPSALIARKLANREQAEWDVSQWVRTTWPKEKGKQGRLPSHQAIYDTSIDELIRQFQ